MNKHLAAPTIWVLCAMVVTPLAARAVTRTVPTEFPTIQAAVDASEAGDTVLLLPGTYRGPGNTDVEFRGRDLTVESATGPENTVIDCEFNSRAFLIREFETRAAAILGLTIINGKPTFDPNYGGGISCQASSPTISDCRILNCEAPFGGGISGLAFSGVIERCVFAGNRGRDGAGMYVVNFLNVECELRDCLFTGNSATDFGGGFSSGSGALTIMSGCTITGNSAGDYGGGITLPNLRMENSIVWGNCAPHGPQVRGVDLDFVCSDVDPSGVLGVRVSYLDCISSNPLFCDPRSCGLTTSGEWTLDVASPCLPANNTCGVLMGALGPGCGIEPPVGACCLPDLTCIETSQDECLIDSGTYRGDSTDCDPDPCVPVATHQTSWGALKNRYSPR